MLKELILTFAQIISCWNASHLGFHQYYGSSGCDCIKPTDVIFLLLLHNNHANAAKFKNVY